MDGTRSRRGAGTVLPAGAGVQGPARWRDLRGLLRDLPPRSAGVQRRHHADRALRGRAHRVRSAPGRLAPAIHTAPAGGRPVPVRSGLLSRPAVPVVRWIHVAVRIQEVLGRAHALADPVLLFFGILLLRAHRLVHFRQPGDPPRDADFHTGAGPADQLHIHHPVVHVQPRGLPRLAPLPVRARGTHGQAVVRMGPPVRPLGHLPPEANGLAGDRQWSDGRPGHAVYGSG